MEDRLFFNKADYTNFRAWAKRNNWLLIKREGVWSATDEPKFLYWLETWLSPSSLIIKIEREADK